MRDLRYPPVLLAAAALLAPAVFAAPRRSAAATTRRVARHSTAVVIPVYGCRDCLQPLYRRLTDSVAPLVSSYELIFVDDRSPDGAWPVLRELVHRGGIRADILEDGLIQLGDEVTVVVRAAP